MQRNDEKNPFDIPWPMRGSRMAQSLLIAPLEHLFGIGQFRKLYRLLPEPSSPEAFCQAALEALSVGCELEAEGLAGRGLLHLSAAALQPAGSIMCLINIDALMAAAQARQQYDQKYRMLASQWRARLGAIRRLRLRWRLRALKRQCVFLQKRMQAASH